MASAGINVKVFSAHSTRTASTSKATYCNISIDTTLTAGGWTNAKTFVMYYNKPITPDSLGAQ